MPHGAGGGAAHFSADSTNSPRRISTEAYDTAEISNQIVNSCQQTVAGWHGCALGGDPVGIFVGTDQNSTSQGGLLKSATCTSPRLVRPRWPRWPSRSIVAVLPVEK